MAKLVTIYGGSGFVGRYIARRMAGLGWRVRVACRRPNDALFVRTYGSVGQVEPVFCNIRDDDSVREVMVGADSVINCVGILTEGGANTFEALQARGRDADRAHRSRARGSATRPAFGHRRRMPTATATMPGPRPRASGGCGSISRAP